MSSSRATGLNPAEMSSYLDYIFFFFLFGLQDGQKWAIFNLLILCTPLALVIDNLYLFVLESGSTFARWNIVVCWHSSLFFLRGLWDYINEKLKRTLFQKLISELWWTADEAALVRKILPVVPWVEFILKSMDMWRDKIKEREKYIRKRGEFGFSFEMEKML